MLIDIWRYNKKSKSLSEVKSFSSFSFSDVALDYKLVTPRNGKLSQSDPSKLDREQSIEVKNYFVQNFIKDNIHNISLFWGMS